MGWLSSIRNLLTNSEETLGNSTYAAGNLSLLIANTTSLVVDAKDLITTGKSIILVGKSSKRGGQCYLFAQRGNVLCSSLQGASAGCSLASLSFHLFSKIPGPHSKACYLSSIGFSSLGDVLANKNTTLIDLVV